MAEVAVTNASPLILLSRAGKLNLLRLAADRILVPEPLAQEILARGDSDAGAAAIAENDWLEVTAIEDVPDVVQMWGLGPGESAVIALAKERPGAEAVIDDLAGRKCAASLDIRVRGTLGIVLIAKRRNVIQNARAVLEDLLNAGMYLSRAVPDEALRRVGE